MAGIDNVQTETSSPGEKRATVTLVTVSRGSEQRNGEDISQPAVPINYPARNFVIREIGTSL